ncbi:hypothetical protein [Nonomuraea zeae]|uniref:Uncharacterized protein n=1 Tax=Nonomuraea zeae TaxID=1642303 RepID=A0A5S4H2Y7_9ACTN|nr:hypothetical protein [Nonomuraea zeae]TMR39618.1 hypothetical protein ETD85_00985 [Nonomuraea zeae]
MRASTPPPLQLPLFEGQTRLRYWFQIPKAERRARWLADAHYSRQKPGTSQFTPPGHTIVLLSLDGRGVFAWHRPKQGIRSMHGLDGWTCTIFRNEGVDLGQGPIRSSELILDAELIFAELGVDIGPDGLLTYVWDSKIKSPNPGYCFKKAGWKVAGRSTRGEKTLLQKLAAPGEVADA